MDFIANTDTQNQQLLTAIGVKNVDDLFSDVPEKIRRKAPIFDDGLSEYEGLKLVEALASKNTAHKYDNYIGAGAYEHHIPAIVGAICSKSEFMTSYTPYQAEISQGMLQTIFEFQSTVCALTGLDVANASVFDGASACSESVLMALRSQKKRNRILIAGSLHPNYQEVVRQYLVSLDVEIIEIPFDTHGKLDVTFYSQNLDENTAAVLIQAPSFLGTIDDVSSLFALAKERGVLSILCANPVAYGIYPTAADVGADIAVGDMQPLGLPLQYGGPYVGYMACRQDLVRQMPGRIVGETVDSSGNRGYVLTLQAREQHIRRQKATSNICTNQALAALATLIATLWYGKEGLKELALDNYQRSHYLMEQLSHINGVTIVTQEPCFNEFVIKTNTTLDKLLKHFRQNNIEPGLNLATFYPEMKDHLLVAVTETKSKKQLDHYVEVMKSGVA